MQEYKTLLSTIKETDFGNHEYVAFICSGLCTFESSFVFHANLNPKEFFICDRIYNPKLDLHGTNSHIYNREIAIWNMSENGKPVNACVDFAELAKKTKGLDVLFIGIRSQFAYEAKLSNGLIKYYVDKEEDLKSLRDLGEILLFDCKNTGWSTRRITF